MTRSNDNDASSALMADAEVVGHLLAAGRELLEAAAIADRRGYPVDLDEMARLAVDLHVQRLKGER